MAYKAEQAKEFFSLKEDEVNQAGVYNNLGILFRKESDYETAIQFFKESIFMYNNLNNSNQRNNVETIFYEKFRYRKMKKHNDRFNPLIVLSDKNLLIKI